MTELREPHAKAFSIIGEFRSKIFLSLEEGVPGLPSQLAFSRDGATHQSPAAHVLEMLIRLRIHAPACRAAQRPKRPVNER
jgi:hypothetical protein